MKTNRRRWTCLAGIQCAVLVLGCSTSSGDSLADRSYWLGNTFAGGEDDDHVQMVINDIAVKGDRVYANSTWDEGMFHLVAYSCRDGAIVGKGTTKSLAGGLWAEGAYGIAADDRYIYGCGLIKKWNGDLEKDVFHNVVWRCDKDLKNANFPGGAFQGNAAVISEQDTFWIPPAGHRDHSKLAGAAVHEGELFVSDPLSERVVVIRTSDMKMLEGRSIPVKNPGWLIVDGDGFLWVVDRRRNQVVQFSRGTDGSPGNPTGLEIGDVEVPTDLCLDLDGNLLVCDNGIGRQQIRSYDPKGRFLKAFGRPAYGRIAADTFFGVSGVDLDASGNLYVATNGVVGNRWVDFIHGRVGRGAELHKQSPGGERVWSLHGLEWVTCGTLDPGSETDYYTPENRIRMDFSTPAENGIAHHNWKLEANTLDPLRYPNDMRMHVFAKSARVVRVDGKKLLIVGSDFSYWFYAIYRFEGDVAIPAALLARSFNYAHKMDGKQWPPNAPAKGGGLWVDRNGNGDFDAGEFQVLGEKLDGWGEGDMEISPDGCLCFHDWKRMWKLPFKGFDEHGVPQWKLDEAVAAAAPEADISQMIRVTWLPDEDVALVGCFTNDHPYPRVGKLVGTEIRRYDHWSRMFDGDASTAPERAWKLTGTDYPFKPSGGGHHGRADKHSPVALHAVDNRYFFVGYDLHSQPDPDGSYPSQGRPDIRVYRMADASFVGLLEPQQEVNFGTGAALDIAQQSFTVQRLSDGRYAIFHEDYEGGKNPYYLWQPDL